MSPMAKMCARCAHLLVHRNEAALVHHQAGCLGSDLAAVRATAHGISTLS